MVFGDADDAQSLDRVPTIGAAPNRLGPKQILVWGCLIGASIGAVVVTEKNISGVATTDHGDSCTLSDRWGTGASGRVLGFLSDEQASAAMVTTQKKLHATINPAFVANKRVVVLVSGTEGVRHVTVLVPSDMAVRVGDQVDFASAYRDRSLPCSYVPNLINNTASQPTPEKP